MKQLSKKFVLICIGVAVLLGVIIATILFYAHQKDLENNKAVIWLGTWQQAMATGRGMPPSPEQVQTMPKKIGSQWVAIAKYNNTCWKAEVDGSTGNVSPITISECPASM